MEQSVPGSQNDHFFELLHPIAARGPPPPLPPSPPPLPTDSTPASPSPADSAEFDVDRSPPEETSPRYSITPSYDFQLRHSTKSSESLAKSEDEPSVLHKPVVPSPMNHFQGSSFTSRSFGHEKQSDSSDILDHVTMHAIDQSIKRHTDTLLQVLESISGRLSQVESTVQALEYTIAELKSTEGGKQDQSNGRLVKLELLIEEVNRGVQLLHEKQKLDEAGLKLTKLQIDEQKPTGGGTMQAPTETWQQLKTIKEDVSQTAYTESSPQRQQYLPPQYPPQMQSHYPQGPSPQGPPPQGPPPQGPSLPQMQSIPTSHNMVPLPSTMNVSPSPQQTYPPSAVHHPPQQPSTQSVLPAPPPSQQIPAFHSQPPTQQPPNSYSLPGDTAQYSHLQPQHHLPPMSTPLVSSYPTEPSQYTGGMHGGPRPPPIQHEVHLPQQHNPVSSHHAYEATGRVGIPGSSMVPSYPQPSPLSKPALPVQPMHEKTGEIAYGAPYRASQPAPSAPSGGSTGYPRLPTAQPVQHGLPSASPVSSGPPTRPPLDDMIENVANMGFPREQVRGVVRQLTENGQSVDLNVVLDTLMNGRGSSQPPRGWFNRS